MIVLAFESTHAAMAAQKLLKELGPYMIPTPKAITASCGMALRFNDEEAAQQAGVILQEHPEIESLSSWHVLD